MDAIFTSGGWRRDYNPWKLLMRALLLIGAQTLTLSVTYWRVCEWNVRGIPITVKCNSAVHGVWSFPCEATLAFARCFPLLAISVSLVVAARFILLSRIYYHLLTRKAILFFHSYQYWEDPTVLLLVGCLMVATVHFILDLTLPPYSPNNAFNWLMNVWEFTSPCCVFFVLFVRGCNIENHLTTVNKLCEQDVAWAKEHLNGSKLYSEKQLCSSALKIMDRSEQTHDETPSNLDSLMDMIIKGATSSPGTLFRPDEGGFALEGLWPGPVLLAKHLTDVDSKAFKKYMRVFRLIFLLVHVLLLIILAGSTLREVLDVVPGQRPFMTYLPTPLGEFADVNGSLYQSLGEGYCRDEGLLRPSCYWKAWGDMDEPAEHVSTMYLVATTSFNRSFIFVRSDLSRTRVLEYERPTDDVKMLPRNASGHAPGSSTGFGRTFAGNMSAWLADRPVAFANGDPPTASPGTSRKDQPATRWQCGKHCSSSACIGFSVGEDYCTMYTARPARAPLGWTECANPASAKSYYDHISQITQANSYEFATCWRKLTLKGEPEDVLGALVILLHMCLIGFFMVWVDRYLG